MTREALLRASIREFADKENNALLWNIERYFTKSGYCYILKKDHKPISCAIHYNSSFETDENVGKYENNDVAINTRKKINYHTQIIEYRDLHIAISSVGNYNNTMKQWHYAGQASFKPIADRFLITDENEIKQEIGSNCLSILMKLDLGYPLVPSYYASNDKSQYIMFSVDSSEAYNQVYYNAELKSLCQYKKDNVKLSFVNIDTKEAMIVLEKLNECALNNGAEFGINNIPSLTDENFYQKSFNWKSLVYSANVEINYHLKANDERSIKQIKDIFFNSISKI